MPRPRPPRTTSAGHLHATAPAIPALPVRADGLGRSGPAPTSPLSGLRRPSPVDDTDAVLVVRALDRGRLCAAQLTDALGWAPGTALDADASRPRVLRLRPAAPADGPVAGRHRAHTDRAGRVVISTGLRHFLGVDVGGEVVAWAATGSVLCVAAAALVPLAIDAYADPAPPRLTALT